MPHRNRVTPFGEIVALPERGTLMGNRGVLLGDDGSHRRDWQLRRWIACRLEFKGRRRAIRQPRRWTELFFLDEATALAAGHRPCAECRREDYRRWQAAWPEPDTSADAMDRLLHADRLDGRAKRTFSAPLGELPDGVIVTRGAPAPGSAAGAAAPAPGSAAGAAAPAPGSVAGALLLWQGALRPWSPGGYGPPEPARAAERLTVLTPRATVAAIAGGYAVSAHPSAT